ncbi:MAG: TerB family tellurite resistance protein [Kiritimatiellia bacterium]
MLNFIFWLIVWYVVAHVARAWSASGPAAPAGPQNRLLEGLSGVLAKMAKADGHVTKEEVDVAQRFLRALRLPETGYRFCVAAFNRAVKDGHAIDHYARLFVAHASDEARQLVYEILWEVASADGDLAPREAALLRQLAAAFGFDDSVYAYYYRLHVDSRDAGAYRSAQPASSETELERAYATLGCKRTDSDAVLRAAYRKQAMRYHPDRLRAEGMPEGLLEKANRSMAEINAAWDVVRKARGIA